MGVEKFISSGAVIPEIEELSHYDPRVIMAPEPKYLAAPAREDPSHENRSAESSISEASGRPLDSNGLDFNRLPAQEQQELLRLLKKARPSDGLAELDPVDQSDV